MHDVLTTGEAYLRYGAVAMEAIAATGGQILWSTDAAEVVIGCDHDRYDEIVAEWYPSRAAFLGLAAYPGSDAGASSGGGPGQTKRLRGRSWALPPGFANAKCGRQTEGGAS